MPKIADTPPRIVFLHTGFPGNWFSLVFFFQNAALAEALASFSGFRSFRIVFPLQRWPHFRASARSESCSRCSAGLISALPLVPHRAPAAALASFPRFRSFRIVLPLQRVTLFPVPCHGMQCNAMLRSAARCHAFSCSYDMQRLTARCHAMLCHATV